MHGHFLCLVISRMLYQLTYEVTPTDFGYFVQASYCLSTSILEYLAPLRVNQNLKTQRQNTTMNQPMFTGWIHRCDWLPGVFYYKLGAAILWTNRRPRPLRSTALWREIGNNNSRTCPQQPTCVNVSREGEFPSITELTGKVGMRRLYSRDYWQSLW